MKKLKSLLNVSTHVLYGIIVVLSAVHEVFQQLVAKSGLVS